MQGVSWTPPDLTERYALAGDIYAIRATAESTNGAYTLIEATVPPGGGPPPHVHHGEDEAFFMLEGKISFRVGETVIAASAGYHVHIERGTPHAFKNTSRAPARMLILCTPGGFDEYVRAAGRPFEDGDDPAPTRDDIARLLAKAPKFGIEILEEGV